MGMCAPDAPDTTPVANANAEAARMAKEAADNQLSFSKAAYEDLRPYLKAQLQTGIDQSKKQGEVADKQAEIGFENNDYYKDVFRPVELTMVDESMNAGSQSDQDEQAGRAVSDVGAQFEAQRAQRARDTAAMGLDPSSGAAQAGVREMDMAEALGKSNAATNARTAAKDKGIALRAGAASFGRNMTNTAGQSLASSVGSGATAAQTAGAGVGNQLAANGQMAGGWNGQYQAGNTLMTGANNTFNAQMGAAQMEGQGMANLGSALGMGASLMMKSSRGLKRRIAPVDKDRALDAVASLDVDAWKYKPGVSDEGEHIGPYAEDVRDKLGENVAPDGKAIDVVSMIGAQTAAIGALKDKMDKIERRASGLRR